MIPLLLLALALAAPAWAQDDPPPVPPVLQIEPGDYPRGFSPEQIQRLQDDLLAMSIDPGPLDGLMGPRTRDGINEFAQLVRVDLARAGDFARRLQDLISAYAGVAASPRKDDWKAILDNEEFQLWVDEDPLRITIIRRSGTTMDIVALLTQWADRDKPQTPAPPAPRVPTIHDIADFESKPLRWGDTSDCGCLRDFGDKTVYGLYPFWLAGSKEASGLDFSVLSRVGYFAVPLDDDGVGVSHSGHWDVDSAAFIGQARRYDTSVDLVIYNDRWERWLTPNAGFIDRLASQISGMVTQPLADSLLNRLIPFISLGGDTTPTMGDGVTLYFDVSPVAARAAVDHQTIFDNIVSLVGELRRRLGEDGIERQLNVMLTMRDLVGDTGVFQFANLHELSLGADLVLVLLDGDPDVQKRALRDAIEMASPNAEGERDLLRKIVPVIDPRAPSAKGEKASLGDDLVYFEDNFAGVGMLPVALAADASVNARIAQSFGDVNGDYLQPVTVICNVVCPNGWWVLGAFEVVIMIGLIVFAAWLASAEVRIAFDRFWVVTWIWGAVSFVIFAALYLCDKFFRGYRDEMFVVFLLVVMLFAWLRVWRRRREALYP